MRRIAMKICRPTLGSNWMRKLTERGQFIRETAFIAELADVPGVVRIQAPYTKLFDKVMVYLRCVHPRQLFMSTSIHFLDQKTWLLQFARGAHTAAGVVLFPPRTAKVLPASPGAAALQGMCQHLSLIYVFLLSRA